MKPNTGPGLALDTAAAGAGDCLLSGEHCQDPLSGEHCQAMTTLD